METVKVLHSRNGVGVKGNLLRVTPERKKVLLELGLVEEITKVPVEPIVEEDEREEEVNEREE